MDTTGINLQATVLGFKTVNETQVQIYFKKYSGVYVLSTDVNDFAEIMSLLAWSYKEQKEISVQVIGTKIIGAKKPA